MLYERPIMKYFRGGQPWAELCDLIYGPLDLNIDRFFNEDVRQRGLARLERLKRLWGTMREDILAVGERYTTIKPWGCRFDKPASKKPARK